MALRNIVQVGDPVLRKKSFPVTDFGEKTHQLLDDMKQTLINVGGVGLAAPQIGVLRRMFIVLIDDDYYEVINPTIIKQSGLQSGEEGCLSVKGKQGTVDRPSKMTVSAFDRYGKPYKITVKEFTCRAFCHEYDHLDGILYIDKARGIYDVK